MTVAGPDDCKTCLTERYFLTTLSALSGPEEVGAKYQAGTH